MEYRIDYKLSKEEVDEAVVDLVGITKLQCAHQIIEKMPMEDLEKIFHFKVIDPAKDIPRISSEIELFNLLIEQGVILIKAKIDPDDLTSRKFKI